MATLQLMPPFATINGTPITTAQLILTPVSPQRKQSKAILPKREPVSPAEAVTEFERCHSPPQLKLECTKRRIHFSKKALNHPRPQAVTRRNTRERNRVQAVNQGFVTLAMHVPSQLRSKKMSKVDTLRAAIVHIQQLQDTLDVLSGSPSPSDNESMDSPATSISGGSLPSSPVYQRPSSPRQQTNTTYSAPLHTSIQQPYFHQQSPQYNQYAHQSNNVMSQHQHQQQNNVTSQSNITDSYQPQCNQFFNTYRGSGYHIDYTRAIQYGDNNNTCPSPTSSYDSSDVGYEHQNISPKEEAELLEFASNWLS